ncbi:hypothetical protein BO70DRAFT_396386 [Aspergillus heteromorphus CBS 117.55]|uniref:Uncharacterized protein n=1 Tax=Aspergillus heteromorphus CBS 117.55 TaxID=1448321 RepID=A0A317W662_9EURO|nr:uncharacterized protein BO70DRAFT_396386 [Aspergillus heteromorphus CBS 117.55]PWY82094.1 hypothetical protein BO70DRAFT_396386 [Aspergillus heteromorphus CBS 117.55]
MADLWATPAAQAALNNEQHTDLVPGAADGHDIVTGLEFLSLDSVVTDLNAPGNSNSNQQPTDRVHRAADQEIIDARNQIVSGTDLNRPYLDQISPHPFGPSETSSDPPEKPFRSAVITGSDVKPGLRAKPSLPTNEKDRTVTGFSPKAEVHVV